MLQLFFRYFGDNFLNPFIIQGTKFFLHESYDIQISRNMIPHILKKIIDRVLNLTRNY